MRLRVFTEAWNDFFFAPQSPLPIGLFRILYGGMVIATLALLHGDWLAWYGTRTWLSLATMQQVEPGIRLNLFCVIPQNNRLIEALFWVFLAAAVCLTAGLFTRCSAVITFICLTSIQQRNLFNTHGGDAFLRLAGFFLIFAPAGAAMSLDRLIRVRRGKEGAEIKPKSPWAQRMIQFELALMYFMSFWWKSLGDPWVNGTALYYVLHLDEIRRFPLPHWVEHPVILKLGSWSTLTFEFAMGTLVWVKEFRYPLLLLGLVFHLCLEYSLNIQLFQWDILTGYVLFLDGADLVRARNWVRDLLSVVVGERFIHKFSAETAHSHDVP